MSNDDDEIITKEPTLQELLIATAGSLKKAFPSYKHLTIGDITLGLIMVAQQHSQQDLYHKTNQNPKLAIRNNNEQQNIIYGHKYVNPEHVSIDLLMRCNTLAKYSDLVYFPIVHCESEDISCKEWYIPEEEVQNLRPCSHMKHLLYLKKESKHFQQAFFCKLDLEMNALIISIRGTKTVFDVLTDFSCESSKLKAHKYYSRDGTVNDEMIEGIVHGGFVKSAQTIFNQIEPIIERLFVNRDTPSSSIHLPKQVTAEDSTFHIHPHLLNEINLYKNIIDKILICGHSMGGGVGSLLAVLLREYFIEKQVADISLFSPEIECTTFGSSVVCDYDLGQWCKQFVNSFILGGDIVSRFSVGQSEILRREVGVTNWKEKLTNIMNTYSRFGYVATKVDDMLVHWGYLGIFSTQKVPQEGVSTEQEQTGETSAENEIEMSMLYPPGNCYLFVRIGDDPDKEQDFEKMLMDAIDRQFGIVSSNDTVEEITTSVDNDDVDDTIPLSRTGSILEKFYLEHQKKASSSTRTRREAAKSYFSEGIAGMLKSAASSIISTVVEDQVSSNDTTTDDSSVDTINPEVVPIKSSGVIPMRMTTDHKFMIRHVDAKHFDRIILSMKMFDDHRLHNMFGAFDCVIRMEKRLIEQKYDKMDSSDNSRSIYVSAKTISFDSLVDNIEIQ
jgi:hypothetical protein